MREDGKQALNIWVTPVQSAKVHAVLQAVDPVKAEPLRATKSIIKLVPASNILPAIPTNAPASIARQLKEAQVLRRKKLAQIVKLQNDVDGIENWYRQSVASCKHL